LAALEQAAPSAYAFSWDKIGLQVGERSATVARGVVSLDRSLGAIRFAKDHEAQLLLTHHPLLFQPLGAVTDDSVEGRSVIELTRAGISHIAAHTNWDAAADGLNDELARRLGLKSVVPFGVGEAFQDLKMVVFVPSSNADEVIDAASAAGAGVIGAYTRCGFRSRGTGTFFAGEGSEPKVGRVGRIEEVSEERIEMVVPTGRRNAVERAVRLAHPYEEPAVDFLSVAPGKHPGCGRVGHLGTATTLAEYVSVLDKALETRCLAWGAASRPVHRVAVVGGAADGEWRAAQLAGADVLVTGEVKQHVALEAVESGFAVIAAGHYATEQPGVDALARRMSELVPDAQWEVFTPEPGLHGRPL
jgi:dinuclear metal center YbgI/SA1388 family protein